MDLEVFVVPNCARCRRLKELLQAAGLAYVERDAAAYPSHLRRLKRLSGGAAVPVLALGEESWPALTLEQAGAAVAELRRRLDGSS